MSDLTQARMDFIRKREMKRMRITRSLVVTSLVMLFGAVPLMAHHAFTAEFDSQQPVHLVGTFVSMIYTNPHSWLYIDVKGKDGATEHWAIEGSAPNGLLRRGWTKNTLKGGEEIVVDGFRSRDGSNKATGRGIKLPDGRQFFADDPEK